MNRFPLLLLLVLIPFGRAQPLYTEDVLAEFGYDAKAIAEFRKKGVV